MLLIRPILTSLLIVKKKTNKNKTNRKRKKKNPQKTNNSVTEKGVSVRQNMDQANIEEKYMSQGPANVTHIVRACVCS